MMVTQVRLKELLDYSSDTGIFRWRIARGRVKPGDIAGSLHKKTGYWQLMLNHKHYLAHRLAWFWLYGQWPNGDLDHKNSARTDNWISNLREGTPSQHSAHAKGRRDGLKGVSWHKRNKKWQARIRKNGKQIFLGMFDTEAAGHESYWAAAQRLYGEFAKRD